MRQLHPSRAAFDDAVSRICCTGTVLALLLVALRTRILFGWSDLRAPGRLLPGLALGAYGDLAYVAGLTGVFVLVLIATRKLAWMRSLTVGLFAGVASLSLLLGFVNVRAIAELGHPVNYQWLYYSNFMREPGQLHRAGGPAVLALGRRGGGGLPGAAARGAPAWPRHQAGGRCRMGSPGRDHCRSCTRDLPGNRLVLAAGGGHDITEDAERGGRPGGLGARRRRQPGPGEDADSLRAG